MNDARAGQTAEGYGRPPGLRKPRRQPAALAEACCPTRQRGGGRPDPNGVGLRGHLRDGDRLFSNHRCHEHCLAWTDDAVVGERQMRGAVRGAAA
jgi:hypothetical protein